MSDPAREPEPRPPSTAEIEAAVRTYLARVARRYAPLALGLVVLLVVVLTVPTTSPRSASVANSDGNSAVDRGGSDNAGVTDTTVPAVADASGGLAPTSGVPRTRATGGTAITPPPAFFTAGTTRGGVQCGPNVRQVNWSVYAPPCLPLYKGNNGGVTSPGVSATTIRAVFRRTNSAEEKAAFAAIGDAAPGTDDQYLADFRAYIDYFNKTYELYGRHVEVVDYNGQGDNLQEDQGQDLQGAQADAAQAKAMGAFMDLSSSPTLASTQPYEEDLAREKIIAIGAVGLPQEWFSRFSPYEYSIAPDGSKGVRGSVHAFCQRMWNQDAVFAGDAVMRNQRRVFGIIAPENEEYQRLVTELKAGIKSECNGSIKQDEKYSINVATMASQSVTVMAQLQSQGVSSVICICDPVVEIFLSQSANQQKYFPEWSPTPWLDPQGRTTQQSEWTHAMAGQWLNFPPKATSEAYRVFKLANPNGEPQEQYYAEGYWTALYIFSALQLAGPNLNPTSFEHGVFSMPRTGTGMFGTWAGGNGAYSPTVDVQLSNWDSNAVSNMDGGTGAWVPCEGGRWFALDDPNAWGPKGTQFHCFGK